MNLLSSAYARPSDITLADGRSANSEISSLEVEKENKKKIGHEQYIRHYNYRAPDEYSEIRFFFFFSVFMINTDCIKH